MNQQGFHSNFILYLVITAIQLFSGIYLTAHYFSVHFATDLSTGGLCAINAFFNCDVTTRSALGALFGIPTSVFGIWIALCAFSLSFIKSSKAHQTFILISILNSVFCAFLLFYSFISLGSLCPVCTLYYLTSWGQLYLLLKTANVKLTFDLPFLFIVLFLGVLTIGPTYAVIANKKSEVKSASSQVTQQLIEQYNALKQWEPPQYDSTYYSEGEDLKQNAPIRLRVFSDYQCPACYHLEQTLHKLAQTYRGKISIQHYSYPLDSSCNPGVPRGGHPFACKAATISYCSGSNFSKVHQMIFDNAQSLSDDLLSDIANKYADAACLKSEKPQQEISASLKQGDHYGLKGTPLMLINDRRIVRILGVEHYEALFNHLLAQ